jgi:hypothetical protein
MAWCSREGHHADPASPRRKRTVSLIGILFDTPVRASTIKLVFSLRPCHAFHDPASQLALCRRLDKIEFLTARNRKKRFTLPM